ncbi:MAG: hypothetical protein OXH37_00035 [Gammaproteobacteria bacterium]|nr:hypothetical protein [Gammaproteobacteria bacterium]
MAILADRAVQVQKHIGINPTNDNDYHIEELRIWAFVIDSDYGVDSNFQMAKTKPSRVIWLGNHLRTLAEIILKEAQSHGSE